MIVSGMWRGSNSLLDSGAESIISSPPNLETQNQFPRREAHKEAYQTKQSEGHIHHGMLEIVMRRECVRVMVEKEINRLRCLVDNKIVGRISKHKSYDRDQYESLCTWPSSSTILIVGPRIPSMT
jgi:hypothetical protein